MCFNGRTIIFFKMCRKKSRKKCLEKKNITNCREVSQIEPIEKFKEEEQTRHWPDKKG